MKLTENDLRYIVTEATKRIIKEAYNNYNAYVLVNDSDGAIMYNYDVQHNPNSKYEAIEDAKKMALKNPFGTYTVYGCINNEYDDNTIVYQTDSNEPDKFNGFWMGQRKR